MYTAQRPVYTWTPDEVQAKVRCHSPSKASGDPFATAYQQLVQNAPRSTPNDKRQLFVVSTLILAPRSQSTLDFFTSPWLTQLYTHFLQRAIEQDERTKQEEEEEEEEETKTEKAKKKKKKKKKKQKTTIGEPLDTWGVQNNPS